MVVERPVSRVAMRAGRPVVAVRRKKMTAAAPRSEGEEHGEEGAGERGAAAGGVLGGHEGVEARGAGRFSWGGTQQALRPLSGFRSGLLVAGSAWASRFS